MNSTSESSSSSTFRGKASVLYIASVTPLHVGIGREEGVVDLPVQRDAYGIPTIYSSSLKGALRSAWRNFFVNRCGDKDRINKVFGSQDNPGSINFFDANMLVFPARSLKGIVIGVTTPFLLKRHFTMLDVLGIRRLPEGRDIVEVGEAEVLIVSDSENVDINAYSIGIGVNRRVVLNELDFLPLNDKSSNNVNTEVEKLIKSILKNCVLPYKGVAIVHDDWLQPLLSKSLIYRTRVKLDEGSKTVATGPWTEELIPPGTVFSIYLTNNSSQCRNAFESYLNCIRKILSTGIFIGGDETVGSGLVKLLEEVECDGR